MALKNIPLTIKDFNSISWEEIISGCQEKECEWYSDKFYAKAKEADNEKTEEVFSLLGAICSFHFKPDNKNEPFGPMMVVSTGRSAIPDDISDAHLQVLQELLPQVKDSEMRARIADVLWIRKRDFRTAEVAIESYLESATTIENPESWVAGFERVHRAFRLSVHLGKRTGYWKKVISHIESVLDKYDGKDPLYLSARLMELLLKLRQGNPPNTALCQKRLQRKLRKKAIMIEQKHIGKSRQDGMRLRAIKKMKPKLRFALLKHM